MTNELDRLLRRVRDRSLPESWLELAIGREIDRLLDESPRHAVEGISQVVLPEAARQQIDAALELANRALSEQRFAAAITALHQAEAALERGRRLQRATYELAALVRDRDDWIDRLALAQFETVPVLRLVDRLLVRAKSLLDRQEVKKAEVIGRLVARVWERLMAQRTMPDAALESRLERLRQTAATLGIGSTRLAHVCALSGLGYSLLAARLADAVENELVGAGEPVRGAMPRRWSVQISADLDATCRAAESLRLRIEGQAGTQRRT